MDQQVYHIPALLPEVLASLDIKPGGTYVDVTFGGGGHSRAIVERIDASACGHLYAFDQDKDAIERAFSDDRMSLIYGNFRFLKNFAGFYGFNGVDGVLADLGVSFHHFDDPGRGFSFRWEGPLDMRMNQKSSKTAAWILANYTEGQLAEIFRLYGELKQSRRLAAAIVKARNGSDGIYTVEGLMSVVMPMMNPKQQKKELAMLFQALRIEVNGEIDALNRLLVQALDILRPGGRLAIITYHSLEDRLVKNFMKTGNLAGEVRQDFYGRNLSPMKLLTSKPIVPSEKEIADNPRSRSAKLRVAEKL